MTICRRLDIVTNVQRVSVCKHGNNAARMVRGWEPISFEIPRASGCGIDDFLSRASRGQEKHGWGCVIKSAPLRRAAARVSVARR